MADNDVVALSGSFEKRQVDLSSNILKVFRNHSIFFQIDLLKFR